VIDHHFSPAGVTVLALLAESHASLHTFPEAKTAFWDCFTCGEACDPRRSVDVLCAALRPAEVCEDLLVRGPHVAP
jgi:S-adenosylmethionine decarboxylase